MRKETISYRQALCILGLFLFGSSVVMGLNSQSGQDAWAALLIGAALAIPAVILYARLMRLFPEMDLFTIMQTVFGKILGGVLIALFAWYALHLGAVVVRDYSEFVEIVALPETPQLPIMIAIVLVTAYLAASGMETLGKWSVLMYPIVLLIVLITLILALNLMDFSNLLPALTTSPAMLLQGGREVFAFPYAETVIFLCIADTVRKEDSPYKIYIRMLIFGTLILMAIILRNITVLGPAMIRASYFPSYTTARILQLGEFLSRIEGSISMNFLLAGITKMTLCLIAAAKGVAYLFGIRDYRRLLMPTALLMLALCAILYKNTMELVVFGKYYSIYALLFQVVIPVVVWVGAEFYRKRHRAPITQNS